MSNANTALILFCRPLAFLNILRSNRPTNRLRIFAKIFQGGKKIESNFVQYSIFLSDSLTN